MAVDKKEDSKASFTLLMTKTCAENEKFLHDKSSEVLREVIELINDSIDYMCFYAECWTKRKNEALTHPLFFYVNLVLVPFSYAILCDLLVGNLPACFMELRFMLESLAKCHTAELPSEEVFFETKILSLEQKLEKEKVSLSKLMKYFGEIIGIGSEPPYSLILPSSYTDDDLQILHELAKQVSMFRTILKAAWNEVQ